MRSSQLRVQYSIGGILLKGKNQNHGIKKQQHYDIEILNLWAVKWNEYVVLRRIDNRILYSWKR